MTVPLRSWSNTESTRPCRSVIGGPWSSTKARCWLWLVQWLLATSLITTPSGAGGGRGQLFSLRGVGGATYTGWHKMQTYINFKNVCDKTEKIINHQILTQCFIVWNVNTHWESRQVIGVKASTTTKGLITRQNLRVLQQWQLSWSQSFTQLLCLPVWPSLSINHSIQQAFSRNPPLRGRRWAEGAAIERHSIWSILDGVGRQAQRWGWHQPVAAQQKIPFGGGEVSAQADLPVRFVIVRTEEQYPDVLQGDSAAWWVPQLDVLSVLSCAGCISVQLVDQEVSVAPGWEVRRRVCASWNHWSIKGGIY